MYGYHPSGVYGGAHAAGPMAGPHSMLSCPLEITARARTGRARRARRDSKGGRGPKGPADAAASGQAPLAERFVLPTTDGQRAARGWQRAACGGPQETARGHHRALGGQGRRWGALAPPSPRVTRTDARDRSAIVLVTATTARRGLLPHAHSGPCSFPPPRLLGRTRRSACATDDSPRVRRRRWTPSFCASLWRSSWRKWPSSWAWSHRGSSRRRLCACAASSVCVSWRNPRATVALH